MKWLLTILAGMVIAWVILSFIGPQRVSYYVQAPVEPTPISLTDVDKIMEAVGLKPSYAPVESVAEVAIMMSAPAPSVADMVSAPPADATADVTSSPQSSAPADQDMLAIPQLAAPAPGPSSGPMSLYE